MMPSSLLMPLKEMMGSLCLKVTETNCPLHLCPYHVIDITKSFFGALIGKFYLVDVGYACRSGFLPPYRGVRYHLSEYGHRNHPTNARELFNLRHSSLRVIVERAFGALKNMFHILDNKPFHPYKTHVKLMLACCILHN